MSVRVGFIGAGGIAGRHLRNLLGFEDVEVVAASDPMLERAQAFAGEAGAAAPDQHWRRKLDPEHQDLH